jgi:hypothetical protein
MSAVSEQGQVGREDPYAPRWLREKPEQRFAVIEELRPAPAPEKRPEPQSRSMSAPSPLDAQLETAVYESLRRQLDPEVMEEPSGLARELDRRDALFGVAGRFALAIGVSALVAVFFVFMIPASRQPDAGASLAGTIEQMKAALKLTPAPQREDAPAAADANAAAANALANLPPPPPAAAPVTNAPTSGNVADYQPVRAPSDTTPPVTHEQSEKLLQQFMRWQQKPAQ